MDSLLFSTLTLFMITIVSPDLVFSIMESFTTHLFFCVDRDDWGGKVFSKMLDGRPANRCYYTSFNYDEATQNVDSLEKEADVSGW